MVNTELAAKLLLERLEREQLRPAGDVDQLQEFLSCLAKSAYSGIRLQQDNLGRIMVLSHHIDNASLANQPQATNLTACHYQIFPYAATTAATTTPRTALEILSSSDGVQPLLNTDELLRRHEAAFNQALKMQRMMEALPHSLWNVPIKTFVEILNVFFPTDDSLADPLTIHFNDMVVVDNNDNDDILPFE